MSKDKVAIVVDGTAYLPEELIQKYNMHVIPLLVNWGGESLRDNVDITADQFYARLQKEKEMPTTSQPSPGDFLEIYKKAAETADSIVCVTISSELSGTYASAIAARDMMDGFPIEVVDSKSTIMGLGFITLAAAEAIAAGADHKEAAAKASALVPRMRLLFVVDTLEFLHRGGRIGGASRFVGTLLSIKPILTLADGKVEPLDKVRTRKKALAKMLSIAENDLRGQTNFRIAVQNAAAPADGQKIANEVKKKFGLSDVIQSDISPVIGTHVGPGSIAVVYYIEP
jgi:DegV family protein with EDD domain